MRMRVIPYVLSLLACGGTALAADAWQALPSTAPAPADNPTTAAKVELGKMLYFDTRFSSTGTVSCFSCHNVMEGGDDHRPTSIGVHGQVGGRNAPTVWNAAFHSVQFWDGRAPSLEEQSKGPPANPIEMGMANLDATIGRIRAIPGYQPYFKAAFGDGDVITMDNAAKAIAAYERTLITPNSAYDRYVKGDKTAMSAQQIKGMETFAATGCTACHSGPAFMDHQMHDLHLERFYVAEVINGQDNGAEGPIKTFTLRGIKDTPPYLHDGRLLTLEDTVEFFNLVLGLRLEAGEKGALVAYLRAL